MGIIAVRKALHTAISYHPVTCDCILSVIEKVRRPRVGKEKAEGPAGTNPAEVAASNAVEEGSGPKTGVNAAAAAALDAIEQTVKGLTQGKEEMSDVPQPVVDANSSAVDTTATIAAAVPASQPRDSEGQAQKSGNGDKRKLEPGRKKKMDDSEDVGIGSKDDENNEENVKGRTVERGRGGKSRRGG